MGETYEIVADFWGAKVNQAELLNSIHQKYAHKTLMTFVNQQGFDVESEDVLEDGTVRVVVGKWV
jgi:hypothetical protein